MRELDQLELLVVVDNETDTLSSIDNADQSPESQGILARIEPTEVVDGHAHTDVFGNLTCACHGFSVLATGRIGEESRTVLFDVGPYSDIWLSNVERLGLDLSTIEAVFLSHWHWDHSGALPEAISAIAAARSAAGLAPPVLDLHPNRPDQRGVRVPDGRVLLLPPEPALEDLAAAGADLSLNADAHDIAGGFFHGSGEIPRENDFETGLHGHVTRSEVNGPFEDDPLILDERYLAAQVTNRGVTVLSACSHAGIINAATSAKSLSDDGLDLVLGGYHLAGAAMEKRIPETVQALRALDPRLVAPGHCTGWRAKAALANEFAADDRYGPSFVGTRYNLR
ncbi:MAG: MBL fold metallo-hydrolase [Acidimicrobiales bacterium]